MTITDEQRTLMTHNVRDSYDLQETKRLWWNLQNILQALPFLDDEGNVSTLLADLETIVTALTPRKKA